MTKEQPGASSPELPPLHHVDEDPTEGGRTEILGSLPARAVAWYLLIGSLWIVVSDSLIAVFGTSSFSARIGEILKGLAFVVVTSGLLWLVLRRLSNAHDRRLVESVTAQRDLYETVLHTSSDMIAIFGGDGRVRYVNEAVSQVLGWRPEQILGERGRQFVHPDDRAAALGFIENVARTGQSPAATRTFRVLHRDGSPRFMEVTAAPLIRSEHDPEVVMNGRDVTDRERREQQLSAALAGDVTGLPGLAAYSAEMTWIERLVARSGVSLVAVLLDINRFGDVNALYGRDVGDLVLQETARRLQAALPGALGTWRHGADEFFAVIPGGSHPAQRGRVEDLRAMVERIRADAEAPIAIDTQQRVNVRVSVGVAEVSPSEGVAGESLTSDLLRASERALQAARDHPDRFAIHGVAEAHRAETRRAELVAQAIDGMPRGEFVVHYQPKVRLADQTVVGAEALVRWEHPTRGLIPPGSFFWAIERANLFGPLTRLVLEDALRNVRGWREDGVGKDYVVSVNVSLDDLRRERFLDEVHEVLSETGADASWLCLELTEQTMLADVERSRDVVAALAAAGIRIAIDDFGTGFSSLEHLRLFAIDEVKVDKSFVRDVSRSAPDEAIVDSVVSLARRLGIGATAEGIEDRAALQALVSLGCELGQGYLFSPPVPAAEFPHRVRLRD